jgi:hypothetical protein
VPLYNNVNRQIVSSVAGLKKATRTYAVKVRSDIFFTGSGFLDFFTCYPKRSDEMKLLQERVINCSQYAKNPRRHFPFPFHPGDWFSFGLREDLLTIWDIPLCNDQEISRWFETHPRPVYDLFPHLLLKFFPEQYMWLMFLNKFVSYSIDYPWDASEKNIRDTELSFANNLIFLSPEQISIRSPKHKLSTDDWATIYTHSEWERLYRDYCDPKHVVTFDWETCAKDMYQICSPLAPKRLLDRTLAALLRKNATALDLWEKSSPFTFRLAKKIYSWFC